MTIMYKEVPVKVGVVRITASLTGDSVTPHIEYHAQLTVNGITYHSAVRTTITALLVERESLYDRFESDLLRAIALQLVKKSAKQQGTQ